jgi:hypothetical protein
MESEVRDFLRDARLVDKSTTAWRSMTSGHFKILTFGFKITDNWIASTCKGPGPRFFGLGKALFVRDWLI